MPTYDYKCQSCGQQSEFVRKISARDETTDLTCLNCSATGLFDRLVSAPLVGYSVTVNGGYGSKVPEGFKDVLRKIDQQSPGSRMKETSSFL